MKVVAGMVKMRSTRSEVMHAVNTRNVGMATFTAARRKAA